VGYLVSASSRTLRDLVVGGPATLLVETIVREDAIALYGFLETAERDWFRILTTVQGVGAKVGLSILSTLSPDEIARAIAAQDRATLSRPAGVGPKLAARLATELKDKAAAFGVAPATQAVDVPAGKPGSINEDAVSALVNLGYKRVEAFGAVARVTQRLGEGARLDAVIRAGLQELAR
jgi:Holliday junction DNA helicase RuvA